MYMHLPEGMLNVMPDRLTPKIVLSLSPPSFSVTFHLLFYIEIRFTLIAFCALDSSCKTMRGFFC